MTVTLPDVTRPEGLKALDYHLLTRSYISGYQASRDDLCVYSALTGAINTEHFPNVARWFSHIRALLGDSFRGDAEGVVIQHSSPAEVAQVADAGTVVIQTKEGLTVSAHTEPAPKEDEEMDYGDDDSDDDEDLDLFGEMTEEEKKAAEEKKKVIEAAKARGAAKAKLTKSMIVLDVKPWDDETDLAAMEAEVRAIKKDGLLWGASKLVAVGYGIKKMQITAVIEDAKVESMDAIIEEELVRDGASETIQSIDIVAFNKL